MALMWTVGLFGLSLLMSQTAIDLFASLLVIQVLWLGYRWREQNSIRHLWNRTGIEWLFVAWFVIVFAGYAANGFRGDDWFLKLLEFRWVILFYLLVTAFTYLEPEASWLKFAAIGFLLCSAWAVIIWFLGFDPLHPNDNLQVFENQIFRSGGFLFQPIVFAHVYQLPLCLLIGLFLTLAQWREKIAWLVGITCLVGLAAVTLSFTRGVWISLTGATLVMLFLFNRRLAMAMCLVIFGSFAVIYKTVPVIHNRIRFAVDGGDVERVWIWKANFEMFKDHPILGLGYGENVRALTEYYEKLGTPGMISSAKVSHAHNQYLQMLSGTGALGFAIYLAIMLYFLVLALRVWKRIPSRESFYKGLSIGLVGAQVAFLLGGLTEANLEHSKMRHVLALIWALTVWLAYRFNILQERVKQLK